MKKIGVIIIIGLAIIIGVAIFSAGEMGKKSPAFAKGKVVLDESLLDAAQTSQALFIIVRDAGQPMPPFGAQRISVSNVGSDVYEFLLTYDNLQRMQPEKTWPEVFHIKVRLDQDGMGGMDQPGDLVGMVENLKRGAEDVVIKIDKKI